MENESIARRPRISQGNASIEIALSNRTFAASKRVYYMMHPVAMLVCLLVSAVELYDPKVKRIRVPCSNAEDTTASLYFRPALPRRGLTA